MLGEFLVVGFCFCGVLWGFLRGEFILNMYEIREVGLKRVVFIRVTKLGRIKLGIP